MSATVLYMSMSLDGFIAGPNVRLDNGLGDGGDRLHEWVMPGAEGDLEAAVGDHSCRRCPPSPSPLPGPALGPAMNPSRDMDM